MGTLIDKLNKIKDTKEHLKNVLKSKQISVLDTDTFASYPDKCKNLINRTDVMRLLIETEETQPKRTFTDEIGTTTASTYIVYPNVVSTDYEGLCSLSINSWARGNLKEYDYIDLSGITTNIGKILYFNGNNIKDIAIKTLVFPTCDLVLKSSVVTYDDLDKEELKGSLMFKRGLIFRGNVHSCASGWLNCDTETTTTPNDNKRVILPKNFTGDLYLNKLALNNTCMVNMFYNLKNLLLSGTGEKYKLTLGTTNLARLSEDDKAIAYMKGWELA